MVLDIEGGATGSSSSSKSTTVINTYFFKWLNASTPEEEIYKTLLALQAGEVSVKDFIKQKEVTFSSFFLCNFFSVCFLLNVVVLVVVELFFVFLVHTYKNDSRHDLRSILLNQAARGAEPKEDEDRSINEKWETEKKTLASTVNRLLDGVIQELIF